MDRCKEDEIGYLKLTMRYKNYWLEGEGRGQTGME